MNKKTLPYVVVGSGPTGVACAVALLAQGKSVLMLDVGTEPETEVKELMERMYAQELKEWVSSDLLKLKAKTGVGVSGVPLKYSYGSDFLYRIPKSGPNLKMEGTGLMPSYGLGGFSNVWGSTVLPYLESDILDWPFRRDELNDHYLSVAKLFQISGVKDELASQFPLYAKNLVSTTPTGQTKQQLEKMQRSKESLLNEGVRFGRSRLALNNVEYSSSSGCVYCGLCMYGCPKNVIYNSTSTLGDLKSNPHFSYRSGWVVESFKEDSGSVSVRGRQGESGEVTELSAEKLFLAAGVISTTTIVAVSLGLLDRSFEILDSQYFLFPILLSQKGSANASSNLFSDEQNYVNTLSQIFLEIQNSKVSSRSVHLQLYSYNPMYRELLEQMAGPFKGLANRPITAVLRRLMLGQGYLHSDESARMNLRVKAQSGGFLVCVEPVLNRTTGRVVRKVLSFLKGIRKNTGFFPLEFMTRMALPGRGFHCGGTLSMGGSEREGGSDSLGRPFGLNRVHCVDASVLPSIPATTITFSLMANAHRIGSHA